jgi:hypothetical protein
MIITENVTIRDRDFIRTYSDEGRYVVRDGVAYSEAIDPIGTGRVYTEGEIMPPDDNDMTEVEAKAKAYDILMGEEVQ